VRGREVPGSLGPGGLAHAAGQTLVVIRQLAFLMNSRKREFPDVLDPFLIENGWFTLNLGTFKVEPATGLPPEIETRVRETITRRGLDSREYQNMCGRYFDSYWKPRDPRRPIPLWSLERDAPFLASEMRRQHRIRPEDAAASP
jgi:hypothetical protein